MELSKFIKNEIHTSDSETHTITTPNSWIGSSYLMLRTEIYPGYWIVTYPHKEGYNWFEKDKP